jgi:hypothetical protein
LADRVIRQDSDCALQGVATGSERHCDFSALA